MKTWTYVALGDSFPAGFGVGRKNYVNFLADYLRQDYSVEVNLENFSQSGFRTADLLRQLRANQVVRSALQNSDLVTLWIGWNDMIYPLSLYESGVCGGEDNLDCLREAAIILSENLDIIFDLILELTKTQNPLIHAADNFIPSALIDMWVGSECFDELKEAAFESWWSPLVTSAEGRGFRVIDSYKVFKGLTGDSLLEGVMQPDGFHFNQKGHQILAELHRDLLKNSGITEL
jgi:lysophospholipase L1-like esterase